MNTEQEKQLRIKIEELFKFTDAHKIPLVVLSPKANTKNIMLDSSIAPEGVMELLMIASDTIMEQEGKKEKLFLRKHDD